MNQPQINTNTEVFIEVSYIWWLLWCCPLHGSQPCCGEGTCVTQWAYEPCCAGPPKTDGSLWRVLTKCGPPRRKWQITPVFLLREPTNHMKRHKDMTLEDDPPGWKVSNKLLGKSKGQLLLAPEKRKLQGQSGNVTQLWMCLVVKVKFNAIKNNIAQEPGMLGPWIKKNWMWPSRRWQDWTLTA